MRNITRLLVVLIAVLLSAKAVFALFPEDRKSAQRGASELVTTVNGLFKNFVPFFTGDRKGKTGGVEEIGWRIHDFLDDSKELKAMLPEYYKNEDKIDALLDKMDESTREIDEALIYTKISDNIKKKWDHTKNFYGRLAGLIRQKVEIAPVDKKAKLQFNVQKVNRIDKKYVLFELLRDFLGGSELDKFPFPDEMKYLKPQDIGEHFIVTWDCDGLKRFAKPLILRFEFKFNDRKFNGFIEETYRDIKGGSYTYTYRNIGADFSKRGKIMHWRASVIYGNKIVAEKKSSMWSVISR